MKNHTLSTFNSFIDMILTQDINYDALLDLYNSGKFWYAGDVNHLSKNGRSQLRRTVNLALITGSFDVQSFIYSLLPNHPELKSAIEDISDIAKLKDILALKSFTLSNSLRKSKMVIMLLVLIY